MSAATTGSIDDIKVTTATTVAEAWEKLQATGRTVLLLVTEQGSLQRTVTDGDLRRLIIAGNGPASKLSSLPLQEPRTGPAGSTPMQALELMNRWRVDQLPLVDEHRRPQQLCLRREIDSAVLLSSPHMGEHELEFIAAAFRTNWIAPIGPNVDAFEREMADYLGARHAAAVTSGTAAIHLGLRLLGVQAGDDVICSSLTFIASANPALYLGARLVFVDADPGTWGMSPAALARALEELAAAGRKPKAIVAVNLYGQSSDMDAILALARQHGVAVLEDAAESLGATYKGRATGIQGDIGIFSFNGNKIITTSGGGMLVSANEEMVVKARHWATQAREPAPYYLHSEMGYNYRMSNVLAGIGRGQLKVLTDRVRARREIFQHYELSLSDIEGVSWMPEASFGQASRWLSVVLLDPTKVPTTPADLINRLRQEGIEARHVWKPLHTQPLFATDRYFTHEPGWSVSDQLFERGVCLPSGSNMSRDQQERVVRAIRSALLRR